MSNIIKYFIDLFWKWGQIRYDEDSYYDLEGYERSEDIVVFWLTNFFSIEFIRLRGCQMIILTIFNNRKIFKILLIIN